MRRSRLGLADNAKKTSIDLLQKALTDRIDLRLAVKQAHWTVRDARFQQLQEFFSSLVGPLGEEIDTMAERVTALGAYVRVSISAVDEGGDADTANVFTGTSRSLDKTLWFVEAHRPAEAG